MNHFTTNTYKMKREILNFSKKISKNLKKPEQKLIADMNYGLLASKSCLLTDIADQLHEPIKKINTVDRLSKHLQKGIPKTALCNYLSFIKTLCPSNPIIHIDDSDVIKPNGYQFEALSKVRDGSASTSTKSVYQKGYLITEATVLTNNQQPVSFFSNVYSSCEQDFRSTNSVTFSVIERAKKLFGKATFIMDRGYDNNQMFLTLDSSEQNYVIRLTSKRKLLYHNKWVLATELRNRRKGKVKLPLFYKGKEHVAYLSHVKVQITASKKDIYLVLIYGISQQPMMLATNQAISSKEDLIAVAKQYFSRWRIEEYFRSKKQIFQFENFRVRKLRAINALNFYITVCMAFFAHISRKSETNQLKVSILKTANSMKQNVSFFYYRIAKGIAGILSYAKEGVRLWFRTKRPTYRQLCLKWVV